MVLCTGHTMRFFLTMAREVSLWLLAVNLFWFMQLPVGFVAGMTILAISCWGASIMWQICTKVGAYATKHGTESVWSIMVKSAE